METQNKFMFFANFAETIRETLPPDKQAEAYQAICESGIFGTLPENETLKGMCLMAKASIFRTDKRKNNGGNHNPLGKNQHTKDEVNSGQSWSIRSKLVNSAQSGQSLSRTETETETEEETETETETETEMERKKYIKKKSIDPDWKPKEETVEKLKEKGFSNIDVIVDRFVNTCLAKNYEYADFDRAILSWDWKSKNKDLCDKNGVPY